LHGRYIGVQPIGELLSILNCHAPDADLVTAELSHTIDMARSGRWRRGSGTGAAGCMKVPSDCAAPNLHKSEKYRQRIGAQCIPPVSAKRLYFLSWF